MAANTIIEIADALFAMFALDVGLGVLVAAIAGIAAQAAWMAGLAGAAAAAVIDREGVPAIITGWQPGAGGVAGAAV